MKKLIVILAVLLVLSLSVLPSLAEDASVPDAVSEDAFIDLSYYLGDDIIVDFPEPDASDVSDESSFATESADASAEESVADESAELEPGVDKLVSNLKYMGLGMLGIFVVIGVVIVITIILNKVTEKK